MRGPHAHYVLFLLGQIRYDALCQAGQRGECIRVVCEFARGVGCECVVPLRVSVQRGKHVEGARGRALYGCGYAGQALGVFG